MKSLSLCFLYLNCLISYVLSARILAFVPFPSKSHQGIVQPLLKELALRGHKVTCYSTYPLEKPPNNYQAIKMDNYMDYFKKSTGNKNRWREVQNLMDSWMSPIFCILFKQFGAGFTEWVLKQKQVQDLIHSDSQFDAIILEATSFQDSFVALSHRFNAPIIEILPSSNIHWNYWLFGNPYDTSYIGDLSLHYSDRMTTVERVANTLISSVIRLVIYYVCLPRFQRIADEHLRYEGWEKRSPLIDIISNTSLVLINTHDSVNYAYPYASHVKQVAGIHLLPPKPLNKELRKFMDEDNEGVILFSFGSSIGVSGILGEDMKEIFVQVFNNLKQKILWKWETDFINPLDNVKISKWFPQQDVLNDSNTKLLICHGGYLSIVEALANGVPVLGIPLALDGHRNMNIITSHNCGISLSFSNISYQSLKWAIRELLDNPKYRENAKKRSQLFHDKPETALETAVYWTEYVIRHKGAHHLRPAIATMPWYQQAMIDVYAAIAVMILIPLYIAYKILRCTCCLICRFEYKTTKHKSNKKYKIKVI